MFEKIKEMLVNDYDVDEAKITENSAFIEDLEMDSLDIVEMVMNLEEEFGVEIADEKAQEMKTIKDVLDYIEAQN